MCRILGFVILSLVDVFFINDVAAGEYKNFLNMVFLDIPAGTFMMGSCNRAIDDKAQEHCEDKALNDANAFSDELPMHSVVISKKIQMGSYEVSIEQFMSYLKDNSANSLNKNPDFSMFNNSGQTVAVTYVSWEDVQGFLAWLNSRKAVEDKGLYRLPTEAEWEYVAKAGKSMIYSFGNSPDSLDQYAWCGEQKGGLSNARPHSLGSKKANPWGIYDMHGNVWEWVADWYEPDYYREIVKNDPGGPKIGKTRVIRGGAFNFDVVACRSSTRESYPPLARSRVIGFRVVRDLPGD